MNKKNNLFLGNGFVQSCITFITLAFVPVYAELPVACQGGACGAAGGPNSWVTSGAASLSKPNIHTLNIDQQTNKAILNWQTFNIGSGNTVNFNQPSTDSTALNRVWDPQQNPSVILGKLNANGQVYLINRNGILFGEGAQVNVHTLIGSTLDIEDDVFNSGIASLVSANTLEPAFVSNVLDEEGNYSSIIVDENGQGVRFYSGESEQPVRVAVDEQGNPVTDDAGDYVQDENGRYIPDENGEYLDIRIELQPGSELNTASGGRIMMLSPSIFNSGDMHTPDGQSILAAGQEVFLASDADLRGLFVAVNTGGDVTNLGNILAQRGNVTLAGLAINQNGRVTATTSLEKNGSIRLLAQDSVSGIAENSSAVSKDKFLASNAGSVTLGEDSRTEVLLELDAEARVLADPELKNDPAELEKALAKVRAVDDQQIVTSQVELLGKNIHLEKRSVISANSGNVEIKATSNPSAITSVSSPSLRDDEVSVQLDDGSLIDVSGVGHDTFVDVDVDGDGMGDGELVFVNKLPMSRNQLELDLRGNELRDSPLQRDGVLRDENVAIDIRKGTEVADISGALENIKRGLGERNKTGGRVAIISEGIIALDESAIIDVSGGSVLYEGGTINTTKLMRGGVVVDIADASPDIIFDAIVGVHTKKHDKWGITQNWNTPGLVSGQYHESYIEGADAGTIQLAAHTLDFQGRSLVANTITGPLQRELGKRPEGLLPFGVPTTWLPTGGTLIIGFENGQGLSSPNYRAPNITFVSEQTKDTLESGIGGFDISDHLLLTPSFINDGGFDKVLLYSNGRITVDQTAPVSVSPGGALKFTAGQIDINADVEIPGGNIDFQLKTINPAVYLVEPETPDGPAPGNILNIADDIKLDVSGQWTNDLLAVQKSTPLMQFDSPVILNGGSINMTGNSGADIRLGNNVTLDASAGGWLQGNSKLKQGKGGKIKLKSATQSTINWGGTINLQAYGIQQGGRLEIEVPALRVLGTGTAESIAQQSLLWETGQEIAPGEDFVIPSMLFTQGGFSDYRLTANSASLVVEENSRVSPVMQNLVLPEGFNSQATGQKLLDFSEVTELELEYRSPVNLTLTQDYFRDTQLPNVENPELLIAGNAHIDLDPLASVSLNSDNRIIVDGTISALSGTINLYLENAPQNSRFSSTRLIWLGQNAKLEAKGAFIAQTNDQELRLGKVLPGGNINIKSDLYLAMHKDAELDVSGILGTLDIGSINDSRYDSSATSVASHAGAIYLDVVDGMLLDGQLKGYGNQELGASGGSLSINLAKRTVTPTSETLLALGYPSIDRAEIIIEQQFTSRVPESYEAGQAIDTIVLGVNNKCVECEVNGKAYLSVEQISNGQFDRVTLRATDAAQVSFADGVNMDLAHSLKISSSKIALIDAGIDSEMPSTVNINAPYISMGGRLLPAVQTDTGNGIFNAHASTVLDITGHLAFQDFDSVRLHSDGDIRMRQSLEFITNPDASGISTVSMEKELILEADQIYPTSFSRFNLQADTLRVLPGDNEPGPAMSAGGQLVFDARVIEQSGVVKAPNGKIILGTTNEDGSSNAESVVLSGGSVTSVSGSDQTVLAGRIENDFDWLYGTFEDTKLNLALFTEEQTNLTNKGVIVEAADILLEAGSIVNIEGGGDIIAFEQIPGPGGSNDVLLPKFAGNTYAILPFLKESELPYDTLAYNGWETRKVGDDDKKFEIGISEPQAFNSREIKAGDSITLLSGANGLAKGEYLLLPARYALLDGAYLVSFESGYDHLRTDQVAVLEDGTPVVPGIRSISGTDIHDTTTSGFAIRPGSYARLQAEYKLTSINEFLNTRTQALEIPSLPIPRDAGRLTLVGNNSIIVEGNVITDRVTGGRGAQADIAADSVIIGENVTDPGGAVVLSPSELGLLNVDSLLIGGTREQQQTDIVLTARSSRVVVKGDTDFEFPELLLVAENETADTATVPVVTIEQGALLSAVEGPNTPGVIEKGDRRYITGGNTAIVRLSTGEQIDLSRSATATTSSAIDIQAQSRLTADGSMLLDSPTNIRLGGDIQVNDGSLHIGADRIGLGNAENTNTTLLDTATLDKLQLNELKLISNNAIEIYSDVAIGSGEALDRLLIDAPGINNLGAASAEMYSSNIMLSNLGGKTDASTPAAVTDPSELVLHARFVTGDDSAGQIIAAGSTDSEFSVIGFGNISLRADSELRFSGDGALNFSGDTSIQTQRITAVSGSTKVINVVDRQLDMSRVTGITSSLPNNRDLGARLDFNAKAINVDTDIVLPSGIVNLTAIGVEAQDNVHIHGNTIIDVSGVADVFDEVVGLSHAGNINIFSQNGSVLIDENVVVNLDAARITNQQGGALQSGAAGSLSLEAASGNVALNGQISAQAMDAANGGGFKLDVSTLGDFSALNQQLNDAGFTGSRDIHVRNDKLVVAVNDVVQAQYVNLTADGADSSNISLDVQGTITGNGDAENTIQLNALNDLQIRSTAFINGAVNESSGKTGDGGVVKAASQKGTIFIEEGVIIDVSGGTTGQGGKVFFRASRNAANDDVNIASVNLATATTGASNIVIEAFKEYSASSITANQVGIYDQATGTITQDGTWHIESLAFMDNADQILGRFNAINDIKVHLRPGIEVQSDIDISVDTIVDLDALGWRYWNGRFAEDGSQEIVEPGVLTLRAQGNLLVNNNITDGFETLVIPGGLFTPPTITNALRESGESWSMRLVGGADVTSSNILTTVESGDLDTGDVIIAADTMVRTGAGDIEISAGRDFELKNEGSVVYTAGVVRHDIVTTADTNNPLGAKVIPEKGGDLSINVKRDIIGPSPDRTQLFMDWFEYVDYKPGIDSGVFKVAGFDKGWYINLPEFKQNLAAFGGGDITLNAGRNINRISASVPTTLYEDSADGTNYRDGSGNLHIKAGGDINSGLFFVGDGDGVIRSGGSLDAGRVVTGTQTPVYTAFALMGGTLDVMSRRDLNHHNIVNPTYLHTTVNRAIFTYSENSQVSLTSLAGDVRFLVNKSGTDELPKSITLNLLPVGTRLEDSLNMNPGIFNVSAVRGDIIFEGDNPVNGVMFFPNEQGSIRLLADGDVNLNAFTLTELDTRLDFLPTFQNQKRLESQLGNVTKLGNAALTVPNVLSNPPLHSNDIEPVRIVALNGDIVADEFALAEQSRFIAGRDINVESFRLQHTNDMDITLIKAGRDIKFPVNEGAKNSTIQLGGSGELIVQAGRDIDLGAMIGIVTDGNQNNPNLSIEGADVTVLAGIKELGDIEQYLIKYIKVHPAQALFTQSIGEFINDPTITDALALSAYNNLMDANEQEMLLADLGLDSKDIDQFTAIESYKTNIQTFTHIVANSQGLNASELTNQEVLESFGELSDKNQEDLLTDTGIFTQTEIDTGVAEQTLELWKAIDSYRNYAANYVRGLNSDLKDLDQLLALEQYAQLTPLRQQKAVFHSFYGELREAGRRGASSNKFEEFSRGYDAIDVLFPGSNSEDYSEFYDGDLNLFYSKIYTLQGGDINILVPGGFVNAGLANKRNFPQEDARFREPNEEGVVVAGVGDINAFTRNNFQVNTSRVFTLNGGDIMMWSSEGNIDAGRGAKTAISAPAPDISCDEEGNCTINVSSAIAGSGIRAIETDVDLGAGDVDLYAPKGIIDAGDAGIGGKNVSIFGNEILGAENIDISGVAVGIPTGGESIAAGLTGMGDVTANVAKDAEASLASNVGSKAADDASDTPLADDALSFLEVVVIGLGEEGGQNETGAGMNTGPSMKRDAR